MIVHETRALNSDSAYKLISATVTPRPIAWVSSLNAAGGVNLAPFSSYTFISYSPPKVLISIGPGTDKLKDTLVNAGARGEFCVSSVTPDFLKAMANSSFAYENGESEATELGIDLAPARLIETPFVAGAAVAMECRVDRIVEVGDDDRHRLIIGTVVCFHIDEAIWQGDRIDPAAYQALGRIGGPLYVTRGEILKMAAPRAPAGSEA
jgi:flavin reductase (DIM6/NTAB) family NADH-FMN oxidoreductase RutF